MKKIPISPEFYARALEIETHSAEVTAGTPCLAHIDCSSKGAVERKVDVLLAAAASAGMSLEDMKPVAVELLQRMKANYEAKQGQ